MTRGEATDIIDQMIFGNCPNDGATWVDLFEKLGMIKLDKTIEDRIKDCCHDENTIISRAEFIKRLDSAGLKIVEK